MRAVAATILCVLATQATLAAATDAPIASFPTAEQFSLRSRVWIWPSELAAARQRYLIDRDELRLFEIRTGLLVGFIPRTRPTFGARPTPDVRLDLRQPIPQPHIKTYGDIVGPLPEAMDDPPAPLIAPSGSFSL